MQNICLENYLEVGNLPKCCQRDIYRWCMFTKARNVHITNVSAARKEMEIEHRYQMTQCICEREQEEPLPEGVSSGIGLHADCREKTRKTFALAQKCSFQHLPCNMVRFLLHSIANSPYNVNCHSLLLTLDTEVISLGLQASGATCSLKYFRLEQPTFDYQCRDSTNNINTITLCAN